MIDSNSQAGAALSEERRAEIDRLAMDAAFKSETAPLSVHEEAVVDLARHLAVVEARNQNLSQQYRVANNSAEQLSEIVVRVVGYGEKLDQALAVARGGVLVGEVEAIESIRDDLRNTLSGEGAHG